MQSINLNAIEEEILCWFISRWNVEVTFEEVRAHMGVETQRQWSDLAIARTTPILFAMFSLVILMAIHIVKDSTLPILQSAWYKKSYATFLDVDYNLFTDNFVIMLIERLCYAA